MIKLEKVTKKFGKLVVLDGVDLEVGAGESLAVIGASGCGKSTLLRLLIRLDDVTSGRILVDGKDISQLSIDGLIALRRKMGFIFQSSALFDSLNVYENVAFALREHAKYEESKVARIVGEKLALVDLSGTQKLMPAELSGGMQRRVSIARALAFDPAVILYDEPTTGLDPITSVTIENLMIKLGRELKVTSIVVTHVLQTVFRTASRVIMLDKGKFILAGTPEETQKSQDPVIRQFITGGL